MASDYIKVLTEADFHESVKTGNILVDFWAPWCGPCRMLAPILEQVAEELNGQIQVCKLNIDEAEGIASFMRVASIPTLVLFQDGVEQERIVGLRSKADIVQTLKDHL